MSLLRLSSILLCFSLAFAKEIRVYAIVEGQVKKVYVKEGDKVKAGDVLVEIDPILYITRRESLSAELESQKLNLEKVERDFKRYEELFNRDLLSKSEYEDWKNRYERERSKYLSLQAQVERVSKLIEYCTLRAPTNGVIRKVLIKEGSFVNGTMIPQTLLIMEER
ncbi:MAG: biotin/lipoyl-binding protein [Hydrogenobacter thermophilus]|uniref:efflux RND transporter periplasmic adaptor subunit n=1 Tax=Hydrogenobacter thermophilus TaxID=940 RepID=UPI001C75A55B|nr:biotin/lipoyl-binding protein [Hydrogenobacter thermophilus]QWK20043.1 MAG: biotin/lipoyl-binding protein [Hydrogenobacter thermophilus]